MEPGGLTGLSVLVVEDDLLLRRQVTALLEGLRMDVTGTSTVSDARRLGAELPFDFVLLDVHLPTDRAWTCCATGCSGLLPGCW
jgi:DNA-binding response OmpR family regulator